MKFSPLALSCFLAAHALASPMQHHDHHLHKRAVVTEVIYQTRVFYQKQVVYVDQNGTPVSTSLEIVDVSTMAPGSTSLPVATGDSAAGPTTTSVIISVATSAASVSPSTDSAEDTAQISEAVATSDVSVKDAEDDGSDDDNDDTTSGAGSTSTSSPISTPVSTVSTTSSTPVSTTSNTPVSASSSTPVATTSSAEVSTSSSTPVSTTDAATTLAISTSSSVSSSAAATSSSSSDTGTYSGDGTYYDVSLGACGWTNSDTELVVALSYELYDSVGTANPNNNPYCGKYINVYRDGKTVQVKVVDRCTGCSYYSLDMSPSAYDQLGTVEEGRIPITWSWAS